MSSSRQSMDKQWLDQKLTITEIEAAHTGDGKPFGRLNPEWEQMKAHMIDGDELWSFKSPPDTWRHLAGRAGIALVRDGEIIRNLVTLMN
jgi:hypothetical protein